MSCWSAWTIYDSQVLLSRPFSFLSPISQPFFAFIHSPTHFNPIPPYLSPSHSTSLITHMHAHAHTHTHAHAYTHLHKFSKVTDAVKKFTFHDFLLQSWNHLTQAQFMSGLELSQIVFYQGRERSKNLWLTSEQQTGFNRFVTSPSWRLVIIIFLSSLSLGCGGVNSRHHVCPTIVLIKTCQVAFFPSSVRVLKLVICSREPGTDLSWKRNMQMWHCKERRCFVNHNFHCKKMHL